MSSSIPEPVVLFPTAAALAHTDRLPGNHATVDTTLRKLKTPQLLNVVQCWLSDEYRRACAPYLLPADAPDEGGAYPASRSIAELRDVYSQLPKRTVKHELIRRIVLGDWVKKK
jgi:hypothetical protein